MQYLEQIYWDRKQNRGYQGLGGGGNGNLVFNGYRVSAWHDEKIWNQVIVLGTQPFYTANITQCEYIYTEHGPKNHKEFHVIYLFYHNQNS